MSQPSAHPDTTPGNVSASTAARVSWALYDFGNSGFPTVVQTFVFAAYFTREVAADPDRGASQWGWAIGGAGVVVALLAPLLGATADRRRRRKFPLALLTAVCILATAALALVAPDISWVWPALLLVALATVAAELAVVLYNSLLPAITNPGTMGRWSG
ncbi:MAG: MFS transporter, partial [Phycisphaeraceae bacterium]|nr:MFS transporter [Phycisphaeraceae bacterium]